MCDKLVLLKEFLSVINFINVDYVIDCIHAVIDNLKSNDGILICNINPYLVCEEILDICNSLKSSFPKSKLRIESIEETIIQMINNLLSQNYAPKHISKFLQQ